MTFQHQMLAQNLQDSKTSEKIKWALIADTGEYKVEYVKWEPKTSYRNHKHLDAEYIFLVSGDLSDHEMTFGPGTLLTYPVDSAHNNLKTDAGAEFILIWTGHERTDENRV